MAVVVEPLSSTGGAAARARAEGSGSSAALEAVLKLLWSTLTLVGPRRLKPLLPRVYKHTTFYFDVGEQPFVGLTIDDGLCRGEAGASLVEDLRLLFHRHDAHATFFVCSRYLHGVEGEASKLVADGHELGNHLEEDLNGHYPRMGEAEFSAALARTTAAIEAIQGHGSVRWFRAPQGRLTRTMAAVVTQQGLRHALGDCYADDWAMEHNAKFVSTTMLRQVKRGSICITHMPERGFREHTLHSLTRLLEGLTARGIKCRTLSEMATLEQEQHGNRV
jgi:peptidoglycan/xylan/chitin deacetylase (PgdA/CDA1 family)